jgi:ribosomal protein S13
MDTIRLQFITVEGFRTFVKPTTFMFPESGLVLVRGINRDTAGPGVDFDNCPAASGIGKTNLLLAISYLFDFCPLPATQLQSWNEDVTMKVSGSFTAGEKKVYVVRGAKGSYISINGVKHTSAEAIKTHLQELTGLTPDLRAILTLRAQRERGMFLNATDGEKKKFLVTVLPWLKDWEAAADLAQKRANEIGRDVDSKKAVLDALTAQRQALPEPTEPMYEDVAAMRAQQEILDAQERVFYTEHKKKKNAVDEVQSDIENGTARLRADNGALRQAEDALARFEPRVTIPLRLHQELKAAHDATACEQPVDEAIFAEVTKAADLLKQVRERLGALKHIDSMRKIEHDAKLKEITIRGQDAAANAKMLPGLKKTIDDYRQRIVEAEQSLCSQCGQTWVKAQEAITDWKVKVAAAEKVAAEMEVDAAKVQSIRDEYENARIFTPNPKIEQYVAAESKAAASHAQAHAKMDAAKAAVQAEANAKYNAVLAKFEAEKKLLEAKKREEQATLRAAVDTARAQIETAVNDFVTSKQSLLALYRRNLDIAREKWGAAVEAAKDHGFKIEHAAIRNENARRQYDRELKDRESMSRNIGVAQAQYDAAFGEMAREQDFAKLVGREGYLGSIFDEILDEIATETNNILVALPNVQHVTVEFVSESLNKSGATSREIKTILRVGGIETNSKGGLSGGQQSAAEWAMDLAVGVVIGRRLGVSLAFLMLDETFDGLDDVTKESALEVLQTYAQDRLVLVVTHANQFKEFFTSFIDIEFAGGESRLVA